MVPEVGTCWYQSWYIAGQRGPLEAPNEAGRRMQLTIVQTAAHTAYVHPASGMGLLVQRATDVELDGASLIEADPDAILSELEGMGIYPALEQDADYGTTVLGQRVGVLYGLPGDTPEAERPDVLATLAELAGLPS